MRDTLNTRAREGGGKAWPLGPGSSGRFEMGAFSALLITSLDISLSFSFYPRERTSPLVPLISLILQVLPTAQTRLGTDNGEVTESILVHEIMLIQPESTEFGQSDMPGWVKITFVQSVKTSWLLRVERLMLQGPRLLFPGTCEDFSL